MTDKSWIEEVAEKADEAPQDLLDALPSGKKVVLLTENRREEVTNQLLEKIDCEGAERADAKALYKEYDFILDDDNRGEDDYESADWVSASFLQEILDRKTLKDAFGD